MRAALNRLNQPEPKLEKLGGEQDRLTAIISELDEMPGDTTVREMMDHYRAALLARRTSNSTLQVVTKRSAIIDQVMGSRFLNDVTPEDVRVFARDLERVKSREASREILHLFGAAFAFAISLGLVASDPTINVRAAYRSSRNHASRPNSIGGM